MNFNAIKSRVQATATVYAEAARSFNSFDEMAAQDEYVHSDSLNVKSRSKRTAQTATTTRATAAATTTRISTARTTTQRKTSPSVSATAAPAAAAAASVASKSRKADPSSLLFETTNNSSSHNSSSNWSLLDRVTPKSQPPTIEDPATLSVENEDKNKESQSLRSPETIQEKERNKNIPKQQKSPPSSSHILSAVASVMQNDSTTNNNDGREEDNKFQHCRSSSSQLLLNEFETIGNAILDVSPHGVGGGGDRGNGDDLHLRVNDYSTSHNESNNNSNGIRISGGGGKKKNPKRFMEDLDRRLSVPLPGESAISHDLEMGTTTTTTVKTTTTAHASATRHSFSMPLETSNNNTNNDGNNNGNNKLAWLQQVGASSQIHGFAGTFISRFKNKMSEVEPFISSRCSSGVDGCSNNDEDVKNNFDDENEDNDHAVTVSSSSLLLGEEEQAELRRISMKQQALHQDPIAILQGMLEQHPHFSFVGFTLVLATVVYFYTRGGTEESF